MAPTGNKTTASQTEVDDLVQKLRRDIFSGIRLPRERLVEKALAETYSVGRRVVRQAVSYLEMEDLVIIEPYKGASVRDISLTQIYENYQIIAMMEGFTVYLATERLTEEDIRNLEGLLTAQKQLDDRQIKEWQSLNHKFHATINLKCGNDRLIRLLRQNSRFTTFWFLVLSSPGRILQGIEEHEKILDSLVRRDADQSRRLVESHLISAGRYLLDSAREIVPIGMWREDG